MTSNQPKKDSNEFKEFFNLSEIWRYFLRIFKSKKEKDVNTKMMHWMNRLAIVVFLIALVIWIVKHLF